MFRIKKIKFQLGLSLLCLVCFTVLLQHPGWLHILLLDRANDFIYDKMLNMNLNNKKQAVKVVIIDIDDYSVKKEGRWPWPRDKIAELIKILKAANVALLGFDIVFSEKETNIAEGLKEKIRKVPSLLKGKMDSAKIMTLLDELAPPVDNDIALANALHQSESVLGYVFHLNSEIKEGLIPKPLQVQNSKLIRTEFHLPDFHGFNGILPLFFQSSSSAGFVTNFPDKDGSLRRAFMIGNYHGKTYASFVFATVMRYLLADKINLVSQSSPFKKMHKGIEVGGVFIPINARGQILIPFFDKAHRLPVYSATDILQHKIDTEELSGSIVIMGSSMLLLADLHLTPISVSFPGVEMAANIVSGVLSQQICTEYEWSSKGDIALFFALGLVFAILFPFLSTFLLIVSYFVSLLLIVMVDFFFFTYLNMYVPIALLLVLITFELMINFSYNFFLERRQKNKMNQLFGQYLPPSHIQELLNAPHDFEEEDTREMTVFFADIRNFTSISETLAAKDTKRLLNAFFTPLTQIIFNHNGTVDKYVGDMIVAFWGAPSMDKDHASHALAAALEIQTSLPAINQTLLSMDLPALKIGMGISSGKMDVGDMGSAFRRSYTVLGDPVNLASRLQDLTKHYLVPILVSAASRKDQTTIVWRFIDKVGVKGRHQPEMIYSPIEYSKTANAALKKELQEHELALSYYFSQNWQEALQHFQKLTNNFPEMYLYKLYVTRIQGFLKEPPPENWDGTTYFS